MTEDHMPTLGQIKGSIGYLRISQPYNEDVQRVCDYAERWLSFEMDKEEDEPDD
jgi:hypothetical protein